MRISPSAAPGSTLLIPHMGIRHPPVGVVTAAPFGVSAHFLADSTGLGQESCHSLPTTPIHDT